MRGAGGPRLHRVDKRPKSPSCLATKNRLAIRPASRPRSFDDTLEDCGVSWRRPWADRPMPRRRLACRAVRGICSVGIIGRMEKVTPANHDA